MAGLASWPHPSVTTSAMPSSARTLPGPHLDLGSAAAGEIPVLEVDELDRALVPGEVDHPRALAFLEEVLELGMPRRTLAELDLEVDHLEIAVEHDDRELLELALAPADLD